MADESPVTFTEDEVPTAGIEDTIEELIDLYGGEAADRDHPVEQKREFVLPLRRGVSTAGGVACTLAWTPDGNGASTVTMTCDRAVDAPKAQRILMLVAGVVGALLFTLWPFLPKRLELGGALAWIGGAIAIAVYFLTLRKTSGGVAFDFLQRLVRTQRELNAAE